MRQALTLALLVSASALPVSAAVNFTLTSNDGGNSTLFTYSFTGEYLTGQSRPFNMSYGSIGISSPLDTAPFIVNAPSSPIEFTSILPDFFVYNVATGQSAALTAVRLGLTGNGTSHNISLSRPEQDFSVSAGQVHYFTGTTTNSVVLPYAFSNFIEGTYRDGALIIGTPIPEPSTYGLILGGLALAGAALRRRHKSKG